MNIHRAIRLGSHTFTLADAVPYPKQVYQGVDEHRKVYKVNDVVQHSRWSGRNNRAQYARLLWTRMKEGRLSASAEQAVRRDYAHEFEKFTREESQCPK